MIRKIMFVLGIFIMGASIAALFIYSTQPLSAEEFIKGCDRIIGTGEWQVNKTDKGYVCVPKVNAAEKPKFVNISTYAGLP